MLNKYARKKKITRSIKYNFSIRLSDLGINKASKFTQISYYAYIFELVIFDSRKWSSERSRILPKPIKIKSHMFPPALQALVLHKFFFSPRQPPVGHGSLIHEVSRSHTTTHHSRQDSSGRGISSSQRPLPANTQHTTNIHASGGIRTHNLSRRAAADLRFRPRGHWDRLSNAYLQFNKYLNLIRCIVLSVHSPELRSSYISKGPTRG